MTDAPQGTSARRFVGWTVLIYWIGLFVSTHIPLPSLPSVPAGSDKVVHLAAFAGLGFLTGLWLAVRGRLTIAHLVLLLAVLLVYGALDEWLQQFVNRHTDIRDWTADAIGATLGLAVVWILQTVRPLSPTAPAELSSTDRNDRVAHR